MEERDARDENGIYMGSRLSKRRKHVQIDQLFSAFLLVFHSGTFGHPRGPFFVSSTTTLTSLTRPDAMFLLYACKYPVLGLLYMMLFLYYLHCPT